MNKKAQTKLWILIAVSAMLFISVVGATQYINTGGSNISIGNNSQLFIDNTNNRVGINNATPGAALDINGGLRITNGLTVVSGTVSLPAGQINSSSIANGSIYNVNLNVSNAPTNNYLLSYNSTTGGFTWTAASSGTVTGSGLNGQISYWTGASAQSGTNSLFWNNTNGELGIGTTAPNSTLHVVGTGNFTSTLFAGSTITGASGLTIQSGTVSLPSGSIKANTIENSGINSTRLNSTNTGSNGQVLSLGANGQFTWTTGATGNITGSGSTGYLPYWSSGSDIRNAAGLYWDSTNNKLGIGTASPNSELQVSGDIQVEQSMGAGDIYFSNGTTYGVNRNNATISLLGALKGRLLNDNPDFSQGTNGYAVYGDAGGGYITISTAYDNTTPSVSSRVLQMSYNGGGSPGVDPNHGYGGFDIAVSRCANGASGGDCYIEGNRYVYRFWANIPTDRTIAFGSNAYGTGGNYRWISTTNGTGTWQEYIMVQKIGEGGTFSSTGFFYVSGGANTAFNWSVASFEMIGIDEPATVDLTKTLNVGYKQNVTLGVGNLLSTKSTYLATDSGSVGIGTTAPNSTLHVSGTANITSTLFAGSTITGANGITIQSGTVSLPSGSIKANTIENSAINSSRINTTNTGTSGQVLALNASGNLTWVSTATGNVVGPASATDNAITRFDSTTGTLIQNSGVTISDTNDISGIAGLTATGNLTVNTNTLKVDSTNNRVGVNTSSPSDTLDVNGNIKIENNYGINYNNYWKNYVQSYSVNSSSNATLLNFTNQVYNANNSYYVRAVVSNTGTPTGAAAYFYGDGTSFTMYKLYEAGTTSNHIRFFLDANGTPSVNLYNHPSIYTILTYTEEYPNKGRVMPGLSTFTDSSGNVGIGNTDPNSTLDVSGTGNFAGTLYAASTITSGSSIAAGTSLTAGNGLTVTSGTVSLPSASIKANTIENNAINSTRLNSTNTGTSGQLLSLGSNGQFTWTAGSTGDVVGPASATDNAIARYDATTGKLIQNSGVTISDTNAISGVTGLTVSGDTNTTGTVYIGNGQAQYEERGSIRIDTAGWKRIANITGAGGRGQSEVTLYTSGGSFTPRSTTIRWFKDWSVTAGLTVTSEVGGGYWNETRITNDTSNSYLEIYFTQAMNGSATLKDNGGYTPGRLFSGTLPDGNLTNTILADTATGLLSVGSGDLFVKSTGFVGINTTSPTSLLHVAGTTNITSTLFAGDTITGANGITIQSGSVNLPSGSIKANTIENSSINSTRLNSTNTGTSGQVLSLAANGQFTWTTGAAGNLTGSGNTGYLPYWSSGSDIRNASNLYWDSTNNRLGIGTTAPNSTLHVVGTGNFTSTLFAGSTITGANGITIQSGTVSLPSGSIKANTIENNAINSSRINTTNTGTSGQVLALNASGNLTWITGSTGNITGSGTSGQIPYWSSGSDIRAGSSLYWDSTNNELGIGANPDTTLAINGSQSTYLTSTLRTYRDVAGFNYRNASSVGTLQITLPKNWSSTMLRATINGYDYSAASGWEVIVSGYDYKTTPAWNHYSVQFVGSAPFNTVRLGNNGSNDVILLGNTSTVWQYPNVVVSNLQTAYSNVDNWGTNWSISMVGSEAGITNIVTPTVYNYVDTSGNMGIMTNDPNATLHVVGTGNFTSTLFAGSTITGASGLTIQSGSVNLPTDSIGDSTLQNNVTINGGTISGTNSISGTLSTTGTLTIGDGGDNIAIDSNNWDVSAAGAITGLTGLTVSSGTVSLPSASIKANTIENSAINSSRINTTNTGTSGQVLALNASGNLTWISAATGDVVGPTYAIDNAVVRFDATTGKLIQNTSVIISDTNAVTGITNLNVTGNTNTTGTLFAGSTITGANGLTIQSGSVNLPTDSIGDSILQNNVTINGGTISGTNNISGTLSTTGTLTIGDGGDRVDISSNTWDVTNGAATGFSTLSTTGTGTIGGNLNVDASRVIIDYDAPNYGIVIKNDTGGWARGYGFANDTGVMSAYGALGSANSLTYAWIGPNYTNPWMTFSPTGYIGINTTSPTSALTIYQASQNTPTAGLELDYDTVNEWNIWANNSAGKNLTFNYNGTNRMQIDGDGNVVFIVG